MFDLIAKNAMLPDGQTGMDIACKDGKIAAIEAGITAEAKDVIDAGGNLVSPPFIDPHFHMDATLSLGRPRMNVSGTLLEGIALWGELKPVQTVDEIVERAMRYCDLAVSKGMGAIRSHVDTCDDTLKGVEALLEVREKVKDFLDLQLVAFPQDGLLRSSTALENTKRALDLAAERGLMVDVHCDESDDPLSRHIETLAYETQRLGLQGRVTGSHLTSMHSMDNYYVSKLIPLILEAGVHAIPNPLINIMLQGRHDSYPKRRGQTRVPELRDAGVTVGFGSDCMMDPWYSLGKADMLDVAFMGLHVAQLSSRADMAWCFDAVTVNSAQIMGLEGYGVETGCNANFVLLQAKDKIEAIRLRAHRLAVVRQGKIIARSQPVKTELLTGDAARSLDEAQTAT